MPVVDPLVSIEGDPQESQDAIRLAGWIVAAEIIAQLREFSLRNGIDVTAIVGPALSRLSESEFTELSRELDGSLLDSPWGYLKRYLSRQR